MTKCGVCGLETHILSYWRVINMIIGYEVWEPKLKLRTTSKEEAMKMMIKLNESSGLRPILIELPEYKSDN